jgi:diaminopimelate decarboxylase
MGTLGPGTDVLTKDELQHFPDPNEHRELILEIVNQSEPPIFLAERRTIANRFTDMARALNAHWSKWTIAYSFKTNYQVAESGATRALGAIAEVVSGHEYRLAKRLGYPGQEIVFNGPYKTAADLRMAIADGARINVNDPDELRRIEDVARSMNVRCPIGLRVNVPISDFPPSHFGFSIAEREAEGAVRHVWDSPHLRLAGLHLHLRGDMDKPTWYADACRVLVDFLRSWPFEHLAALEYIDLGGGYPAHMSKLDTRTHWDPRPIDEYIVAITQELRRGFEGRTPPRLILEPGRYLVNDAIIFVSRIVSVRDRAGAQQIVCNGATTMVPFTRHRAPIIRAYRPDMTPRDGSPIPSNIYGASCREDDVLFQGTMERIATGDLLVHFGVGAYNSSINPAFIFPCPTLRFIERGAPVGFGEVAGAGGGR